MPRFVVLFHELPPASGRASHFDLMLERGDALWTLALARWPAEGESVACERLPDHRLAYLDYEGPVSAGRGSVMRHESGTYEVLAESPESMVLRLAGAHLRGRLSIDLSAAPSVQWHAEPAAG